MYHHSADCKNSTAPPAPFGCDGISADTSALAPEISTTETSTRPARPTAMTPSPDRSRVAMSAPSAIIDSTATARDTHIT